MVGTTSQAPIVTLKLNTVNDPQPGILQGQISGSITPTYPGMLGVKIWMDSTWLAQNYDSSAGTLYGGLYMYVGTNAAALNLNQGKLAFWDTSVADTTYQVDTLESQNGGYPLMAGVFLNKTSYKPVTAGNYTWIQIGGRMTIQCRTTVTSASRNIAWANAGAGTDNATFDGIANATAVSAQSLYYAIPGVSEVVAANGAQIIFDTKGPCPFIWRQ